MRKEAEPGEGREAGPYLVAEDAVRLLTPDRHFGAQRGFPRELEADVQPPRSVGPEDEGRATTPTPEEPTVHARPPPTP